MATSGRINTGSSNFTYGYVQWQMTGQEIGNNRSHVNWQAGVNLSNGAWWGTNAIRIDGGNVHTASIPTGTWSNISGNGDRQLRSGSVWVGHNNAGAGSFGYAINVWLLGTTRTASGGSGALPTIPRNATITGGSTSFDDTQNPTINYSNPAGNAITTLQAGIWKTDGETTATGYINISKTASSYTFSLTEDQRNTLRGWAADTKSMSVRIYLRSVIGGVDQRPHRTVTLNIVGGEPTFSNFTFQDTNSATVAVTGNNQALIQGQSTLRATVSTANGALPNKQATMKTYTFSIGGYSSDSNWSGSADVVKDIGVINDVTGSQNLSVRATDSRANTKAVTKNLTVLPYSTPGFLYAFGIKYANSFDASSGIAVEAFDGQTMAIVAPLTLGGVDKNSVNSSSGVKFDMSKGNNSSYTETLVDVPTTSVTIDGLKRININPTALGLQLLTKMNSMGADNSVRWFVRFQITDALHTMYYTMVIDVGRPIMRIGNDGLLYHNEIEFSNVFGSTQNVYVMGPAGLPGSGTWGTQALEGLGVAPGVYHNSPANQGDFCVFPTHLARGVYRIRVTYLKAPDAPIVRMYWNGQYIYDWDLYGAGGLSLFNLDTPDFAIEEGGSHDWAFEAYGKNGSSSGHHLMVAAIRFIKTGEL